jgi:RNA polymerase sigma-70 factor, ECF subfamily
MESVREEQLIARLRANDGEAFEELVRTYGGRLLSVARRFVRNESDAHDILQAAYLCAFRSLSQFEGNCQISTWLHRIVVNQALTKLRTQRRKPEESIEPLLPAFQEDGHHVEHSPTGPHPPTYFCSASRRARRFGPASISCRPTTATS